MGKKILKRNPHARGAQGRGGVGILFMRRRGVQILLLEDDGRRTPPDSPHRFRLRRYGLGGRSRNNHFKKFAPEGQIFGNGVVGGSGRAKPPQESPLPVPCPPGGSGGLGPPGISVNYPCLASAAAVPCPRALPPIFFRPNFFVQIFFVRIFFVRIF